MPAWTAGIDKLETAAATQAEIQAHSTKLKASPRWVAFERANDDAIKWEYASVAALFDFPVASLADLRAKLEYLTSMPGEDDSFGMIDNPATTLMRSILAVGER